MKRLAPIRNRLLAPAPQDTSGAAAVAGLFPTLTIGGIECDSVNRVLRRDGRELHLRPKEFDLIVLLMRNIGKTFSREALLTAIWDGGELDVRTVDVHVGRLRKALNREFYPDPIASVRGRGYRFRADFEQTHAHWQMTRPKKFRLEG